MANLGLKHPFAIWPNDAFLDIAGGPDKRKSGRGDRIRTYDLLVPNQALYQAKLHPETRRSARAILRPVKRRAPEGNVNNLCLPRFWNGSLLRAQLLNMDTISRENNSSLPIGGIIVGVVALLLGGYAAISLSKVNKTLAAHEEKIAKIDGIESQVGTTAASTEKATKDLAALTRSTQDAFNQVGGELANQRAALTKLEEAAKKPVVAAPGKKGGGEPAVAGPGEYVVKGGDTGTKIAKAQGVSHADLLAVNPGVNWNKLKVGDKLKLPKK